MDYSIIKSDDEFFDTLAKEYSKYTTNTYFSLLKDTSLNDFLQNKQNLIKLLEKSFWIYDALNFQNIIQNNSSKVEHVYRPYLFAFIKNDYIEEIPRILSKKDLIVCVHNHLDNNTYIYRNNKKSKWKSEEFILSYEIKYDKFGYPKISTTDHLYDYGSDIYEWSELLVNCNQQVINKYTQITILTEDFKSNKNLISICAEIMNCIYL